MANLKRFYQKYRHGIPLLIYGVIFLTWFVWLEKNDAKDYQLIHMAADDYIPFCEVFVIPYLLWFVYMSSVVLFLFLRTNRTITSFALSCLRV